MAVAVYHVAEASCPETGDLIRDRDKGFRAIPGLSQEILEWHEFREMLVKCFN